jgi:hypothetical protein
MTNTHMRILSLFMIFLLITPLVAMPQGTEETVPSANFTKEELDQMLAPVALYPDSLLSQILMASTYPIELVEADRWVKQNPNLTGVQLDEALKYKDWDVSVKSLCHFPTVLSTMSQNLDETTRLGNAFLNQQQDVMGAIQELRAQAQAQGNLNTTAQQRVIVQQRVIEIVPADPGVIYVPAYNPAVVYGPWSYPAYPPYVWYPGVAIGIGISFGVGFFVGAAVSSWSGFDWGNHYVNMDMNRTTVFNNVNIYNNGQGGWQRWDHNPQHRRGVAYWNNATSQRFGQSPAQSMESRRQFSGYGQSGYNTQNLPQKQFQQGGSGGGSVSSTKGGSRETGINTQSLQQKQFQQGGSGGGSVSSTKGGGHETGINTQSLPQKQFKQGGTSGGSVSSTKGGGHETGINTQSLPQKQFKQGGTSGGSVSSTKGGGRDSAFSGINNWNSDHLAGQRGQASHIRSSGGGGHSGGSPSSGNQKKEKGH